MLVYLLLLAAVVALGYFTDIVDFTELKAVFSLKLTALLKLAVMVLLVLLVSNLVIFILHGIKPRTHRGGSVLSLLSSLVKYVAGIIIVCQSLSLLGVNVGTIIASVGVLALVVAVLLRQDAKKLTLRLEVRSGGREGSQMPLTIVVRPRGRILVSRCMEVDLSIENLMFGSVRSRKLHLRLGRGEQRYQLPIPAAQCGQVCLRCDGVRVLDVLDLFSVACAPVREVRTTIYPRRVRVQVLLSQATVGSPRADSMMQNRQGNDPSELFDIREYVPGDDIRPIHWKLSSKTEQLIVRQSSEPFSYHMALLPDLGRKQGERSVDQDELNGAVALGSAIAQGLLRQGVAFCAALPTAEGLELCEIRTQSDFARCMDWWLSYPIPENSGASLQTFLAQHWEGYFTRLLLLTAGPCDLDLTGLDGRIGLTVVSAVNASAPATAEMSPTTTMVELLTHPDRQEAWRVVC